MDKPDRAPLDRGKKSPDGKCCGNCAHFDNNPITLEEAFKGINILSSVHGCSRGDAGICTVHDRYLLPMHSCPDFLRKL
jgi:hypothetical protein